MNKKRTSILKAEGESAGRASVAPASVGEEPKTDATRDRLLAAALEIFGNESFDGASTRRIADAAGANLQAINYYFGSKQGLYDATADYLVALVNAQVGALRSGMRARLDAIEAEGRRPTRDEARTALREIVTIMLTLFSSDVSSPWVRFMVREQTEPTAAFHRVYDGIMEPMLTVVHRLLTVLLGEEDPESEYVRLRTLSFLGSLLVFRVVRATIQRQMDWTCIGDTEVARIATLAGDLVAGLEKREDPRT